MSGPTGISPSTGTWVITDGHTPEVAVPISPTTGTWVMGTVTSSANPISPSTGTWLITDGTQSNPAVPISPTTGTWLVTDGNRPGSFGFNLSFGQRSGL